MRFPSWSSLQTIEYELKLHQAPLSILHSTTLLLLFVFISIGTTRRVFFVSTFAICSLMMYVDWITLHYWITLLNTLVRAIEMLLFVCKPLQSDSSFHPFHIFLHMLRNRLGTYISPFSHSIHKMLSCLRFLLNLVFLDCLFSCLNNLSDLFVPANHIACVF